MRPPAHHMSWDHGQPKKLLESQKLTKGFSILNSVMERELYPKGSPETRKWRNNSRKAPSSHNPKTVVGVWRKSEVWEGSLTQARHSASPRSSASLGGAHSLQSFDPQRSSRDPCPHQQGSSQPPETSLSLFTPHLCSPSLNQHPGARTRVKPPLTCPAPPSMC